MTTSSEQSSDSRDKRKRAILALLILILLLALCGIGYVIVSVVRSPERTPQQADEPGVEWVFSGFGGSFGALSAPQDVAYDGSARIYVTEPQLNRVTVFDRNGQDGEIFAEAPMVKNPRGIDVGDDGNIYIADDGKVAVVVLDAQGELVREIAFPTVPISVQVANERLYVGCPDSIHITTLTGEPLGQWGTWGRELDQLASATGIAADDDENIYITDTNNYRLVALDSELTRSWQYGATATNLEEHNTRLLSAPWGVTIGGDGNVYFIDGLASEIGILDEKGKAVSIPLGGPGTAENQFNMPKGIEWMEDDLFVIADTFHDRIVGVRLTPQAPSN